MDKYKYFYVQFSTEYGVGLNNNSDNIYLIFNGSKTQYIHKILNRPTINNLNTN